MLTHVNGFRESFKKMLCVFNHVTNDRGYNIAAIFCDRFVFSTGVKCVFYILFIICNIAYSRTINDGKN